MKTAVNGDAYSWGSIEIKIGGVPFTGVTSLGFEDKPRTPSKRTIRKKRVRSALYRVAMARQKGRLQRQLERAEERLLRTFNARTVDELGERWGLANMRLMRDSNNAICLCTVAKAAPEFVNLTVGFSV